MRRRPLALPACGITAGLLLTRSISVEPNALVAGLVLLLGMGIVVLRLGYPGLSLALACLVIALGTGSMAIPRVPFPDVPVHVEMPVRIQGVVMKVVRSANGGVTCVVEGHMDGRDAPCAMLRTVCTDWSGANDVCSGEERVIVGRMRMPSPPALPDEFDERALAAQWNVSFIVHATESYRIQHAPWWSLLRQSVYESIASITIASAPQDVAGVIRALVLGDRSGISRDRMAVYQRTGTAHMFSISGSHVGLLLLLVVLVFSRWSALGMVVITSVLVTGYIVLTGFESPAVRAACMGIAAMVGRLREDDVDGGNLLCGSVIILAVIDPWGIDSVSTILSVSAVLGLIVLAPRWTTALTSITGPLSRHWHALVQATSISVAAATAITVPSLVYFHTVSITSVVANLVVVPLLSIVFVLSPLLLLCTAAGIALPLTWSVTVLIRLADFFLTHCDAIERGMHRVDLVVVVACLTLAMWWWPLVARMPSGAGLRWGLVCIMLICVRSVPESRVQRVWLYEVPHGAVVGTIRGDTMWIFAVGSSARRLDTRVLRWVRLRREHRVVAGHGRWGRRMAARISHDVVGSKHETATRISHN